MLVPYSMDESEPDLYGGMGGQSYDYPPDDRDLCSPWEPSEPTPRPQPKYVFYSEEELAQSEVFHRLLNKTLKCKERQIDELRQEILKMME